VFTLAPGETQTVRIRLTRTPAAPAGVVATGHLTWVGQTDHTVRIPLAVRPSLAEAPAMLRAPLASRGTVPRLRLRAPSVPLRGSGLAGAFPPPSSPAEAAGDRTPLDDGDTVEVPRTVPVGSRWLRVAVETNHPRDDVDLLLVRDDEV